jgi:hypothetical protein
MGPTLHGTRFSGQLLVQGRLRSPEGFREFLARYSPYAANCFDRLKPLIEQSRLNVGVEYDAYGGCEVSTSECTLGLYNDQFKCTKVLGKERQKSYHYSRYAAMDASVSSCLSSGVPWDALSEELKKAGAIES